MIKSVTVTNYLGESIILELGFPEKSGFLVRAIEGLGPSKANVNVTEVSTMDGSIYNSAHVTTRNIIFTLGFLWKPTIETVRQLTYKYFPLKKRVKLLFVTDNRECFTYGYVESNEPDVFSKEESARISIICPDPYFYSSSGEVTVFSGITPLFEFPFGNESLSENLLELGEILALTTQTVYYSGDAEVGAIITIHALGAATNVSVYNLDTRDTMSINTEKLASLTGSAIIAGDDIIISTVKGDKYIKLLREGVYTNILNCLDKASSWIQLAKGDNLLAYTADTGATNLQFRVENQVAYEGV